MAVDNPLAGFDANQAEGANYFPDILLNCSAYRNDNNYHFQRNATTHLIKNCVGYLYGTYQYILNTNTTNAQVTNSWQVATVTAGDFMSLDTAQLYGARQANGSLPVITFLKPVAGSDLVNAGTDVGLNFVNPLPDIGYLEYTPPADRLRIIKSGGKVLKSIGKLIKQ